MGLDRKKKIVLFLLAFIIFFQLVSNFIWLKLDKTYLIHDAHHHYLLSLGVYEEIKDSAVPLLSKVLERVNTHHRWHGILAGYATGPFHLIFGTDQDTGVMISSSIFLTILLASVYGIGTIVSGSAAGLLAAFLVGTYPLIFNQCRVYMLDLPLAAMVCLSVYLLLRSENFTNKKFTFLCAAASALGILCKFNFVIFLAGPFLFVLGRSFSSSPASSSKQKMVLVNIVLLVALAAIIIAPFLSIKRWEIWARLCEYSWLNPGNYLSGALPVVFLKKWIAASRDYLFWLIPEFVSNMASFIFTVAFFIALPPFFKKKAGYKTALLLWLFIPVIITGLFFRFLAVNRYLMPLLPPVAIITAVGLLGIPGRFLRRGVMILFILLGTWQYFIISYDSGWLLPEKRQWLTPFPFPTQNHWRIDKLAADTLILNRDMSLGYRNGLRDAVFPQKQVYPCRALLNAVMDTSLDKKNQINVFFADRLPQVYEPFEFLAYQHKYPVTVTINSPNIEESQKDNINPVFYIVNADYVAIAETAPDTAFARLSNERALLTRKIFDQYKHRFYLVASYAMPDNNHMLLYKRSRDYAELASPLIRIYFREGLTKLFFQDRLVTNSSGISSRLKTQTGEFISNTGDWKIERAGNNRITAQVTWPDTACTQLWEFQLTRNNEIALKIRTTLPPGFLLQAETFSFSLSPRYTRWSASAQQLRFESRKVRRPTAVTSNRPSGPITLYRGRRPELEIQPGEIPESVTIADPKDCRIITLVPDRKNNAAKPAENQREDTFLLRFKNK